MAFLHEELDILHRDLKSANVLIDRYFHAKVADFGDSRFLGHYHEVIPRLSDDQDAATAYAGMGDAHVAGAPSVVKGIDRSAAGMQDADLTRGVGTLLWMSPEIIDGGTFYTNAVSCTSFHVESLLCRIFHLVGALVCTWVEDVVHLQSYMCSQ